MKNNTCIKRLYISIVCIIMLLAPLSAGATNEAVLSASNSVVRVYAESAYSQYASIGSGFAVGIPGEPVEYIVTNYHVIRDDDDSRDGIYDYIYVVLGNIRDNQSVIRAEIVCMNREIDYCILKIPPTTERTPLTLLSAATVQRTQEVYALGFPSVSDDINDDGASLPSTIEDVTITRGVISKTNSKTNNAYFLQMDTVINSGNSGGPLVTVDGYCVGINTFGASSGDSTNGAMYIDYTIQAMNDFGVPYTLAGNAPSITAPASATPGATPGTVEISDGDYFSSLVTGIIIVAVIISLLAVLIVIISRARRRKKSRSPQPAQIASNNKVEISPEKELSGKTIVIPSPRKEKGFSLVGITGVYSGSIFPISSETVIGRDPARCNIVFPEQQPGVSSVHCRIIPGIDCLLVEDMGSSYGTFLMDGRGTKLEPHKKTPLAGESGFYLASDGNSFIVRRE